MVEHWSSLKYATCSPAIPITTTCSPTSWAEIAAALNMTETEAPHRFHTWMTGQLALHRRTGTIGLTAAESQTSGPGPRH